MSTNSLTAEDAASLRAYMAAFPVIGNSTTLAFYLQSEGIEL
ncbi:hypothetical protein [Mycolicibacterium gilvum]